MEFEWDEAKNARNVSKHGIEFAQAVRVFERRVVTLEMSDDRYREVRKLSIGRYDEGFIATLTVIHTDRNEKTRIISARPASRKERQLYEKTL